jgi:hypothetical protein
MRLRRRWTSTAQFELSTGEHFLLRVEKDNRIKGVAERAIRNQGVGWSEDMNRRWYWVVWVFEIMAIVIVALILTIPTQDFARRAFFEWYQHRSTETLRALREKQHEEFRLRLSTATPFAIAALLLVFPLFRIRPKSKKSKFVVAWHSLR